MARSADTNAPDKGEDAVGGARIDGDELTDADPPLPGEGRDDPLTRDEATALEKGVDPDTGFPARGEALL